MCSKIKRNPVLRHLAVGDIPDISNFEKGSNQAENFGMAVGETGVAVATSIGAPAALVKAPAVATRIGKGINSVSSALGKTLGQQGPVFGESRLGAPTTGLLNGGRIRIGFTAHKNTAIFRVGIGNNSHINIFTRPRIPR